ncbi:class I adenylate-forming enzyme family protein [Nocardia nova]|uniref:class I adenylate-forming enzyme family protein n=1 Tax=Nocardia nova TaxID=37330 RepID=UPI0033F7A783
MTSSRTTLTSFAPDDPGTVCVVEAGQTLTWEQLDERSNRLASALENSGVDAGDVVAIRLHTRADWVVVSLGLAKLGATAVGLNFKLTPPETTYILRDCGVRAAIIDDADPRPLVEAWATLDLGAIVCLDDPGVAGTRDYGELLASGDPAPRPARDLAQVIIYTSGTTGAPKGAPIDGFQTRPDKQVLLEYGRSVGFDGASHGKGTITLISLPMHHGAGPNFTRACLRSGGTVVFQRRFDAEEALALIEANRVTHWIAVPTMLQRVVNLPAEVSGRYDLSSMRFLLGGAAPFGPELKSRALDLFGDVVYEIYGCTEAGMMAGARPEDLRAHPATSGRPFRHVSIKIVDEQGRELPPGRTGEIAARTPVIIDGYVGRGRLGSDKLLADGHYLTGDVGHLDADGYLYIYDRLTDMVIAGGVNIYPAEIEAVLNMHPAVALSAVIGEPHEELGEQPVAVVQLRPGCSTTTQELLDHCDGRLAKFKWPRRFDFVDEIPTNPVGKILKRELKKG